MLPLGRMNKLSGWSGKLHSARHSANSVHCWEDDNLGIGQIDGINDRTLVIVIAPRDSHSFEANTPRIVLKAFDVMSGGTARPGSLNR